MKIPIVFAGLLAFSMGLENTTLETRILDEYAVGSVKEDNFPNNYLWKKHPELSESFQMLEDNVLKAAAPECRFGLGWVYHKGFCYLFTSYHTDFLKAEELCNQEVNMNLI